ncbi:unnamed protein product [Amoebophrya sp. A25]|nr:unnamed protein product [Amoebophrya sp. A25]|eukprot:GSA25T00003202001.1
MAGSCTISKCANENALLLRRVAQGLIKLGFERSRVLRDTFVTARRGSVVAVVTVAQYGATNDAASKAASQRRVRKQHEDFIREHKRSQAETSCARTQGEIGQLAEGTTGIKVLGAILPQERVRFSDLAALGSILGAYLRKDRHRKAVTLDRGKGCCDSVEVISPDTKVKMAQSGSLNSATSEMTGTSLLKEVAATPALLFSNPEMNASIQHRLELFHEDRSEHHGELPFAQRFSLHDCVTLLVTLARPHVTGVDLDYCVGEDLEGLSSRGRLASYLAQELILGFPKLRNQEIANAVWAVAKMFGGEKQDNVAASDVLEENVAEKRRSFASEEESSSCHDYVFPSNDKQVANNRTATFFPVKLFLRQAALALTDGARWQEAPHILCKKREVDHWQPRHLSNILWSYAVLGHVDARLFDKVTQALLLGDFKELPNYQDLSNAVWALAKVSYWSFELALRAQEFFVLSNSGCGTTSTPNSGTRFVSTTSGTRTTTTTSPRPSEVAALCWALAATAKADDTCRLVANRDGPQIPYISLEFFKWVASKYMYIVDSDNCPPSRTTAHRKQSSPNMRQRCMVVVLHSFATLGLTHSYLVYKAMGQLEPGAFSPQDVSNVAWSLAYLVGAGETSKVLKGDLPSAFLNDLWRRGKQVERKMSNTQFCTFIWAISVLRTNLAAMEGRAAIPTHKDLDFKTTNEVEQPPVGEDPFQVDLSGDISGEDEKEGHDVPPFMILGSGDLSSTADEFQKIRKALRRRNNFTSEDLVQLFCAFTVFPHLLAEEDLLMKQAERAWRRLYEDSKKTALTDLQERVEGQLRESSSFLQDLLCRQAAQEQAPERELVCDSRSKSGTEEAFRSTSPSTSKEQELHPADAVSSSALHREVEILNDFTVPGTHLDADFAVTFLEKDSVTKQVLVEVDGPSHYLYDVGQKKWLENGPTACKRRLLETRGYRVVNLNWREIEKHCGGGGGGSDAVGLASSKTEHYGCPISGKANFGFLNT